MSKPRGRQTRKKVHQLLCQPSGKSALSDLARIPEAQLINHLFSHFYHTDPVIKMRSITAMGTLGARLAEKQMEKARILMRRIMWNLNDESGGIGWGSPEAMGEILSKSPPLAREFKSILFSYLDPGGNFIEHGILQQGVLWGIGTYLKACPRELSQTVQHQLLAHTTGKDPVKQAYAVRALADAQVLDPGKNARLFQDHTRINIFTGWNFVSCTIQDLARSGSPEPDF